MRAVQRANCTHVKMGLLRIDAKADERCDLCGRIPRLRSFYVCQQDEMTIQYPVLTPPIPKHLAATLIEIQQLGMSQSVVDQAKRESYTPAQLEKLINQRKNVLATIEKEKQKTANGSLKLREQLENRLKLNGQASSQRCTMKFCQLCRPYFKDRAVPTLDSVLDDAVPKVNQLLNTQVSDARVVRNLGMPKFEPAVSQYQSFATAFEDYPSGTVTSSSSSSSSYKEETPPGFALTEEAVETGMPDIITQV